MGILSNLLEGQGSTVALVEEVVSEYQHIGPVTPVLEAVLQIAYENYAQNVSDVRQLKGILEEIADYVVTALALLEGAGTGTSGTGSHTDADNLQHKLQQMTRLYKDELKKEQQLHQQLQKYQGVGAQIGAKADELVQNHPVAAGVATGVVGGLGAYGLYKLGKKVYEKLKAAKQSA